MANERQAVAGTRVVDIDEMEPSEIATVLQRAGYGHLGLASGNQPYVLPIHYVYDPPEIYIYTTQGMKTEVLSRNPAVCLQAEEVTDVHNWTSVIATGRAELLTDPGEREKAAKLITLTNPSHTPAISRVVTGGSERRNVVEIYKIRVDHMSGRKTRRTSAD